MVNYKKVCVLGGGSWGTAIVKLLLHNVDKVTWHIRSNEQIEHITNHHHNPNYLSSVNFDISKLHLTDNIEEAINENNVIFFCIPAPFLQPSLANKKINLNDKILISAIKGIIPSENLTLAEFFNKVYNIPFKNISIVSGPCHAEEIALERLSYLTVASKFKKQAEHIASMISGYYLKTNISNDIYGIEYAAVLKNIYAITAGICHGLGYGDNFLSVLISNAHNEIKRFLDTTYKHKRKLNTSPYLGDLIVTAYSQFSRNRTFGNMIGKGYSVKSATLEMNMVAEGYYATKCIHEINLRNKVDMPITEAVYRILYEKNSASLEIKLLTEKLK